MTGNEVGDRVHNFFAQDNLPQGQHHSQVADGSWPSLNNNFWSGSQKQVGASSSSPRNYNSLQSDCGRGDNGHPLHVSHGLDFTQNTPEFTKSQPQSQQQNWNGYMYGRQNFPARQDEANFVGVDSESDRHNVNTRGLFMFESQQGGVFENIAKNSVRPNTSDTPVSFDLFGGQQHMNGQQSSMLQGLPQQQSGFANMQELQQQLMFRKMQELQRQKEVQQLDARQQNTANHVSSFERQASGGHPRSLFNGNPIADTSAYPWGEPTAGNTNWLQRASPAMQGTSSGLVFPPEQGQEPPSMGFGHQQANQSLYGVPVSNSRENLNHYPRMATEKTSIQQLAAYNNSFQNQYAEFPDQVTMQDRTLPSRQGFQGKSPHDNASGQNSNSGMSVDHPHLLNPLQQNSSMQEFRGPQELIGSSEILQDKKAIDDAVTLDPTEEKILFGSDDNIWDAFGTDTITGEGASNLLDGNGFLNGLPSLQSGSWSALMQSAVAETSSSDVGLQEESAGLSCQKPELASGVRQPSRYDGANANANFHNAMGSQQYGQEVAYEHGEGLQVNSSKRPNPQSSGGSKLFNRGAVQMTHADINQISDNSSHSLDVRKDGHTHRMSQQSGSNQLISKTNNWNGTESVALSGDRAQNLRSEQSTQHPQSNDWKRGPHEEIGHADSIWKVNPVPKSSVNAAVPNLSTDNGQFLSNNHPHNYWKQVDSSLKSKGSEGSGNLQLHQNKGPQVSESSLNSSEKEELKMHEIESNRRNENSSSSYHSNISRLVNTGGLRENLSTDAGDSRPRLGDRQNSFNQVTRKTAPQKFQYHPMGVLGEDVEQSYETRQGSLLQAMSQQHSSGLKGQDQGYLGKSKLFGQVPKSSDTGKGHGLNHLGEAKGYDEARSRGTFPGYMHNMFGSADRSSVLSVPNNSQPSQNMLELLHKVDQSREHGAMKHFNSSEQNQSSEIPDAENSDGSVGHLQRSQSSNSQGFGLHLAPPLQQFSVGNHASPRTLQTLHSASSSGFRYLRNQAQNQALIVAEGHVAVNHSENSSFDRQTPEVRQADESCSSVLRAQPVEGLPNAAGYRQYDDASSFDTNRTTSALERVQHSQPSIREKFPVSQPGPTSVISHGPSSGMMPNLWTNVPAQQHSLGIQAHKFHANLSHPRQPNVVESTSSVRQNIENQDAEKRGNFSFDLSTSSGNSQGFVRAEDQLKGTPFQNVSPGKIDLAHKMDEPQGNESLIRHTPDLSSVNPDSTQRDLEDFGRSLKPNNFHQSYSLLNQMRAMKDSDSDTSSRGSKRLKEPENYLGGQTGTGQPNERNNMVGDVTVRDTTVTSADSKMLSFSGSVDNGEKSMPRQLGSAPSRDMLTFRQNESQSYAHGISSVKAEHTQISPQMAPSWFNQYGTFKNGQILPIYEMQTGATMNTVEQPFSHGNSSGSLVTDKPKELASPATTDTGQMGVIMHKITPASVSIENIPSSLPTNVSDQNYVALRQKKRKSPHPWHEEVSQSSWNLHILSMAEAEWAKAVNRRIEKVKDDGEVVEDIAPLIRSRRRLVLTTQLMQQLLRPPPATVLSADASSNYEIVSYFVARLALGDACSLISSTRSSSDVPHGGSNMSNPYERTDDQHLSEVKDNFMGRARKLENDLLSMEKRASVLDLRVECQDHEKFSVIIRFAKFHGHGQPDGADGYTAANAQKPVPQRYVTAVPLPKDLPDRVQCLSL